MHSSTSTASIPEQEQSRRFRNLHTALRLAHGCLCCLLTCANRVYAYS